MWLWSRYLNVTYRRTDDLPLQYAKSLISLSPKNLSAILLLLTITCSYNLWKFVYILKLKVTKFANYQKRNCPCVKSLDTDVKPTSRVFPILATAGSTTVSPIIAGRLNEAAPDRPVRRPTAHAWDMYRTRTHVAYDTRNKINNIVSLNCRATTTKNITKKRRKTDGRHISATRRVIVKCRRSIWLSTAADRPKCLQVWMWRHRCDVSCS